jgi:hypothetical protein
VGDYTRNLCEKRRADLQIERDSFEVTPATPSFAIQRQRIQAVVDDWAKMSVPTSATDAAADRQ